MSSDPTGDSFGAIFPDSQAHLWFPDLDEAQPDEKSESPADDCVNHDSPVDAIIVSRDPRDAPEPDPLSSPDHPNTSGEEGDGGETTEPIFILYIKIER